LSNNRTRLHEHRIFVQNIDGNDVYLQQGDTVLLERANYKENEKTIEIRVFIKAKIDYRKRVPFKNLDFPNFGPYGEKSNRYFVIEIELTNTVRHCTRKVEEQVEMVLNRQAV